ncbi:alpha-latrocrustotoxin-Lt1a-like [Symsagittifera roscoffensis]|uniref:alpha-latrocrustotoxin-Lt1a-like n=1 Tax=Symsagittifera roscoffensis TaxID=84072 RepID=UPI00307BB619
MARKISVFCKHNIQLMMAYLTQQLKPYRYDDYAPHEEFEDVNRYWYQAKGGSWVCIPKLINPYDNLNVRKGASIGECKTAFRELVSTPNRQKRMLVAYSWHMITNEALYRIGERTVCDVFDYAISGNTGNLKLELEKHPDALECTDTSGSSLLYIAARSGFYDTCEFLLDKGAKPGLACGSSESTPLHAASYYGHDLVCMLLISRGAKVDAKNKFGNTPADEAKTHELNQKLQLLKNGDKPSPMARLTGSLCLENVTHNGKTVARLLRLQNIEIPKNWLPAWHGTKYNYLNSILKNGLQPSGAVVDGVNGVNNWASAVFISPILIYAG